MFVRGVVYRLVDLRGMSRFRHGTVLIVIIVTRNLQTDINVCATTTVSVFDVNILVIREELS
jgi:hypothetical protein